MSASETIDLLVKKALTQADKGEVLPALDQLRKAKIAVQKRSGSSSVMLLNKVDKAEILLMSRLCFQIQKNEQQNIKCGEPTAPMRGRLFQKIRNKADLPVADLPLKVFWTVFGKKQSLKIKTAKDGSFVLNLPPPQLKGEIKARVILDVERFSEKISISVLHNLKARELHFHMKVSD